MMTILGTHMQGLDTTQVRQHAQIELLTCRVCFIKHVMINKQVHHHTHLDLSTCRVCFVKYVFTSPDSGTIPKVSKLKKETAEEKMSRLNFFQFYLL